MTGVAHMMELEDPDQIIAHADAALEAAGCYEGASEHERELMRRAYILGSAHTCRDAAAWLRERR